MPILEAVTGIVSALFSSREAAGALIGVLLGMKAISAFLALKAMIKAVAEIFAGNAKFGPAGLVASIAGVAALTGAIGMATTRAASAGDVMSPAKGKTMVSTREGGLYELSKNDDLVAAPGAVERMKNTGSTTVINQTSPSDNTETKRTNMLLEKIANTPSVFKIGADEFFSSTSKYSYQVQ
jgi:hypothetical protein